MRTTVDIDKSLLERLREEARAEGVPFKETLHRVLRRGLERPREHVEPYEAPAFAMGAPKVALDKALAVADALQDEEAVRDLALRK